MDMKNFLSNQIRAALEYKWCKGVSLGRDPGSDAVSEWIATYAEKYRKEYDDCLDVLIDASLNEMEKRIKAKGCTCERKKLRQCCRIAVEEFTHVWFLEMAKPNHDKHVEEI